MVGSVSNMASTATAMQAQQVQAEVGVAVARKTLDAARQQGAAVADMLETSANLQQAMVQRAISEPHKGTLVDVLA